MYVFSLYTQYYSVDFGENLRLFSEISEKFTEKAV